MKMEKRNFIRALRGTGLTVPERAQLYKTDRDGFSVDVINCLEGMGWVLLCAETRGYCERHSEPYGFQHYERRGKVISMPFGCSSVSPLHIRRNLREEDRLVALRDLQVLAEGGDEAAIYELETL